MNYKAVSEKKIHILRLCSQRGTMKTVARQVKWCMPVILTSMWELEARRSGIQGHWPHREREDSWTAGTLPHNKTTRGTGDCCAPGLLVLHTGVF